MPLMSKLDILEHSPPDLTTLKYLLESMPNLKHLKIEGTNQAHVEPYIGPITKSCPDLLSLELTDMQGEMTEVQHLTQLRTLKIDGHDLAVMRGMNRRLYLHDYLWLTKCSFLVELSLQCTKINDNEVALIIIALELLEKLDIIGCRKVSGKFLKELENCKRVSPPLVIHCRSELLNLYPEHLPMFISFKIDMNKEHYCWNDSEMATSCFKSESPYLKRDERQHHPSDVKYGMFLDQVQGNSTGCKPVNVALIGVGRAGDIFRGIHLGNLVSSPSFRLLYVVESDKSKFAQVQTLAGSDCVVTVDLNKPLCDEQLEACTKINDNEVALIIIALELLEKLDIIGCRKVSGKFLKELENCKRVSPPLVIHCRSELLNLYPEHLPMFISFKIDMNKENYYWNDSDLSRLYGCIYPASSNKPPVASSATGTLSINSQLGGESHWLAVYFQLLCYIQSVCK
eukprot:sb/3464556/